MSNGEWFAVKHFGRPDINTRLGYHTKEAAENMARQFSARANGKPYAILHLEEVVSCTREEQDASAPKTITLCVKGKRHTYVLADNCETIEIDLDQPGEYVSVPIPPRS